jgi:hypothetical protein
VRIGRTETGEREGVCGSRIEKEKWVGKKERDYGNVLDDNQSQKGKEGMCGRKGGGRIGREKNEKGHV